jgi:hypothetical protein
MILMQVRFFFNDTIYKNPVSVSDPTVALVNGRLHSGEHVHVFDADNLLSGVYIYRVQAKILLNPKRWRC